MHGCGQATKTWVRTKRPTGKKTGCVGRMSIIMLDGVKNIASLFSDC